MSEGYYCVVCERWFSSGSKVALDGVRVFELRAIGSGAVDASISARVECCVSHPARDVREALERELRELRAAVGSVCHGA